MMAGGDDTPNSELSSKDIVNEVRLIFDDDERRPLVDITDRVDSIHRRKFAPASRVAVWVMNVRDDNVPEFCLVTGPPRIFEPDPGNPGELRRKDPEKIKISDLKPPKGTAGVITKDGERDLMHGEASALDPGPDYVERIRRIEEAVKELEELADKNSEKSDELKAAAAKLRASIEEMGDAPLIASISGSLVREMDLLEYVVDRGFGAEEAKRLRQEVAKVFEEKGSDVVAMQPTILAAYIEAYEEAGLTPDNVARIYDAGTQRIVTGASEPVYSSSERSDRQKVSYGRDIIPTRVYVMEIDSREKMVPSQEAVLTEWLTLQEIMYLDQYAVDHGEQPLVNRGYVRRLNEGVMPGLRQAYIERGEELRAGHDTLEKMEQMRLRVFGARQALVDHVRVGGVPMPLGGSGDPEKEAEKQKKQEANRQRRRPDEPEKGGREGR